MFERYTEKARRAIFFARYEASQFLSPNIETEHLLLGLLRENRGIVPFDSVAEIRKEVEDCQVVRERISTSVDLPLSNQCQRALAYAAAEADRLGHKHIGTEHLVLGLLREHGCLADELLRKHRVTLDTLRARVAKEVRLETESAFARPVLKSSPKKIPAEQSVEIHGTKFNAEQIRHLVYWLRAVNWYWQKQAWKEQDIAVHRKTGSISLDMKLAEDPEEYSLVKGGRKKDYCAICRWELWESKDEEARSTGYTNGRDWLCTECYGKFIENPNFFSTNYPEMT